MPSRQRREEVAERRGRPATTPEGREIGLVSLAMDLAEKQIREGTASSQVITHFLKAGSLREELEQERIRHENELTQAKIANMAAAERMEELYAQAIDAMRSYRGEPRPEPEDEPD